MMDQPSPDTPPPAAKPDEDVDTPGSAAPRVKDKGQGFSDTESPGPIDAFGDLSQEEY